MNTRSFIKSLLVASIAPNVLIAAAEDRYRWKCNPDLLTANMPFNERDFYGGWRFIQYRQTANGLWARSGTDIEGWEPCPPPTDALYAPYVCVVKPAVEEEVIFLARKT